jgi:hypothetical protein
LEFLFDSLDFLYTPSSDVASDAKYFAEVLGGRIVFAVEGMGAGVAMIELSASGPKVLLADHLKGERPVLVYRVSNLDGALSELESRGWQREQMLEIPFGPCCSFVTPGGHRVAVYELTRPEVQKHFEGRRDF